MTEKIHAPHSPERHNHIEHTSKQERENLKHIQETARNTSETSKDELQAIKQSIEQAAISGKEYNVTETESSPTSSTRYGTTKKIKNNTYKRTLRKTQAKLPVIERSFSKIIHNHVIEKTSDAAANTIARPSGILIGGIGALLGSIMLLFISKRSGFSYNYLFFLMIFVGCYLFGIVLEFFLQLLKPKK